MTGPTASERRRLLRAGGWLALVNVAAVALIGLRYLWLYGVPFSWFAWLYVLLAYVGHASALAFLPFVLLTPVALLAPRPRLLLACAALVGGAGLSLLLVDSLVFAENRYHLSLITLELLAPYTWAFFTLYFLVFVALEAMVGLWVWRRCAGPPARRVGRFVVVALVGTFVLSHLIHAWAEARYYVPVTSFAHYLPLYEPPDTTRLQVKLGLVDRERAREHGLVTGLGRAPAGALSYPLAPLRCTPPLPAYNVLLVVIDAMRAEALTPAVAPRLTALAPSTIRFDAHYSGGNSSRAGMFSLFYGLPATYWAAFAAVARPPVLMDLFRQHGYQLGLFSSSPVYGGVGLDRTALAREPNLRLRTDTPGAAGRHRDGIVTDEWIDWLERRDRARPFFGFLYFDAPQAKAPPDGYPPIVTPPPGATKQQRLEARYLTAVHYVDSLVGRVLDDLTRRGLDDRTLVIVTSDHGMEFGENSLGFTGHGTAYSEYQMRTPLLMRWPGRAPARIARRTSHLDVAPTLVTELFGCANPPADYSSGQSLFSGAEWTWLVAGSYSEFALLEPDQVTVVYSTTYEIRDASYHLVSNPRLRRDVLRAALREMSRFYR
ncbi:MAG TPA: DUF3413 domain-containing protein [Methylomirabilota bacterium]|nr:DUF3413 domain-containing protein [Methylomirabilota bacterium]